ncbi:MAG: hypothetical protein KDC35_16835 [Acidobacteria bacterium]|nr:hypothetical protein [Acidobacteriota bacterium]
MIVWMCVFSSIMLGTLQEAQHDYVMIGYIPSRGAAFKGEPYKKLQAEVLAFHKRDEVKELFDALQEVAKSGVTDNATRFHEPVIYLEVMWQGDRVRLSYSGPSQVDRYRSYEQKWLILHQRFFEYLSAELVPKGLHLKGD